jgi:hypothetical protein
VYRLVNKTVAFFVVCCIILGVECSDREPATLVLQRLYKSLGMRTLMGFFSSILGGKNETLNEAIPKLGQTADWATGEGKADVTAGTNFYKSILSGDSSKQMQAVGGTVGAAKTSVNQDTKTATEMGTRSGGTAASNAATTDKFHSWMTNLFGDLTGKAAESLTSTGGSLIGTGLEATGQQIGASQQRMNNWEHSLAGKQFGNF